MDFLNDDLLPRRRGLRPGVHFRVQGKICLVRSLLEPANRYLRDDAAGPQLIAPAFQLIRIFDVCLTLFIPITNRPYIGGQAAFLRYRYLIT